MEDEERNGSVEEDVRSELGISPTLAAAAAFEGVPRVLAPVLSDAPHGLAKFLMSGQPIEAGVGTPLGRLSEFTRSEAKAISDFARKQGVDLPIIAAGKGFESGYFMDNPGPIRSLLLRLAGEPASEVVPHIGLNRSSIPQAFHEIGHASPIAGSHDLRRTLQSLGKTIGTGSSIGHLLRAGLASSALMPPDEDSSRAHRFIYENSPALVAATTLPELAEEARASYKAVRGAREAGYGTLKVLGELAPSFGTYVAAAAAPVIATLLAKKLVEVLRSSAKDRAERRMERLEARRYDKYAAPMSGAEVKAPGLLRTSASAAWRMGTSPPKPKSIGPGAVGTPAKERAQAKPPSKQSFYKDMLESLYNPARGSRLATPAAG